MMMLYLFPVVPVSCMYMFAPNPPPFLPPAPAFPAPNLAPRPPARRYGQAGGPREAAGGGREKVREKGGRPAGKGATADGNDSRGWR